MLQLSEKMLILAARLLRKTDYIEKSYYRTCCRGRQAAFLSSSRKVLDRQLQLNQIIL